ncbi:unnamed protein product [Rotaria socialis]|uniref:Uncharacterized protein n=2 Tax=Rotaria socialis TaxID=392032 RepID=A0A818FHH8_9BILA|nr:unnamed protein product [Rotaria socialis]CAF3364216.1 unnamed protein product [Rotaria socialis]CAF3475700.1 unnamed protein product [Rotaria socialis]CAF4529765.1 unnamed protein product [Rotaria socialis]CAF4544949.1 unnamed protein product [Rotaria socialis]
MSATHYQNHSADQRHMRSPEGSDMEKRFNDAKSYITSTTGKDGVNLYDHLVKCVSRLLTEQPRDSVTIFEDVSKLARSQQVKPQEQPAENTEHILAEEQKPLFEKSDNAEELDDEALQSPLPHILEQAYYFEQAGIGLGRDETYRIWLALKQLVDKGQYEKVRFWGKIVGTEKNYYIAEVEQNAEEEADDDDGNEETSENDDAKDADDEEGEGEEDPLPKSTYKAPPSVPKEERGTGVNKYTYHVCNHPGSPWVRLPIVTPAQVSQARQIKVFFTGDLNREIKSFPAYPGTEKNYLRAQIARISATTHVSPAGKFKFSDEEEETEEEGGKQNYQENEDFTGAPLSELVHEDLNGWVHHVLHVLPQGRTKWWNPNDNGDKEEEEAEEEEDMKAAAPGAQPEQGPPLLTPIGVDAEIQNTKAWTAKISSNLIPQYACAFVRSNLWPGAYAFARGMIWENIYVGFGHKYSTTDYRPELPPLPANEYTDLPENIEIDDPTPEDEAKARAAEEHGEEGEEEHEEEAENEEEDD